MAKTDHPLKRVVALTPEAIAAWLLGVEVIRVTTRKDELSAPAEQVDADLVLFVTLADGREIILHIEFQALGSRIPMPLRMLDYDVRIALEYRNIPIFSVVIYLGGAGANDTGYHTLTDHTGQAHIAWQYGVVHLWQMTAEELLAVDKPTLAVLIGQTRITHPERNLREAIRRINESTSGELRERLLTEFFLLCTDKEIAAMASKLYKQDYGLPDPPILDIWREEGIEIGLERGLQQGRAEGRAESLAEVTLRQLTRRFGALPDDVVTQVRALGSTRLFDLAEALLDFTHFRDLTDWLAAHGR